MIISKNSNSTDTEQNHPSIPQEHKKSQLSHRRNQEESNCTREMQLDNHIFLDKGSCRKLRE